MARLVRASRVMTIIKGEMSFMMPVLLKRKVIGKESCVQVVNEGGCCWGGVGHGEESLIYSCTVSHKLSSRSQGGTNKPEETERRAPNTMLRC